MATSKTLTPTNVTIQIPEFTDQPDQRVNSNCIDKEADAINALNTQLQNLIKVASYTLTEQITIGAHSSKDFGLDTFGIPSSASILGGFVYSYNDANSQELIVYLSVWYNSRYVRVGNFSNNACTLSSGRVIYVYYC